MQKSFTIELRCSYADRDKYPVIQQAVMGVAAHLYAQANLIADMGGKSIDIMVTTDDSFHPRDEIKKVADMIAQGIQHQPAQAQTTEDTEFTESLLKAFE